MREPVKIVVGETEYDAFDEDHSISDVARWLHAQGDSEAAIMTLQELVAADAAEMAGSSAPSSRGGA